MSKSQLKRLLYLNRMPILLFIHAVAFALSYSLATLLRFDFTIPQDSTRLMLETLPWVVTARLVCSYALGSFHGWMRYVTFHDLVVLIRSTLAGTFVIVMADYFLLPHDMIPRSITVLDCLLTILLIGALRSVGRLSSEQLVPFLQMRFLHNHGNRGAILVGANPRGVQFASQIHAHAELNTRIVGFLDPNESLHNRRVAGMLVLGHPTDVAVHAKAAGAQDVYVLADVLHGKDLRHMVDQCREANLNLKVLPGVNEFVAGQGIVGPHGLRLRDIDINDLLRRDPVRLDTDVVNRFVKDKVVVVTGAGGSIGSEICRQLLPFEPAAIVLVERAENNLFQIDRELRTKAGATRIVPCMADVTDVARMRAVFDAHHPQVLFHAAAHKHVPMMEYNPGEALKNNTLGTRKLADLAHEYGLEGFVLISTDKAVNPTSIMGLSKQLAERYVHTLSQSSSTRFIAVRFGNVLGSVGSVVPIFQEQIRTGGPIMVTHPDMRRFFMTIPEASQLVMQAGAMGKGGEIFVLDMGEPVKIVDLARDLIRLSGLSPDDIEIHYSGVRPGEKLFEELYFDDEQTLPTPHPKLRVAYHRAFLDEEIRRLFLEIGELAQLNDQDVIFRRLREMVPEYACDASHAEPSTEAVPLGHALAASPNAASMDARSL
jgi:FlaA1/EpsC-like NDP-sugar epimerase